MLAKMTSRLLAGMIFLCCLTTTSAPGQQFMYTYTDTWIDAETVTDQTGENSASYVVGCGVAEIDSSSLAHAAGMNVGVVSLTVGQRTGALTGIGTVPGLLWFHSI